MHPRELESSVPLSPPITCPVHLFHLSISDFFLENECGQLYERSITGDFQGGYIKAADLAGKWPFRSFLSFSSLYYLELGCDVQSSCIHFEPRSDPENGNYPHNDGTKQ